MSDIVGRDEELGGLIQFVTTSEGLPGAVVLEGPPGIGKTTLWRWAISAARERGVRVLAAAPAAAEAGASFVGLSDLLAEHVEAVLPELAPPRREALEGALQLKIAPTPAPDRLALGLAVQDALRFLARAGPVLVAVDDLQWLDPASAAVLEFAARRFQDDPVGLLLATRPPAAHAAQHGLARALPADRVRRLELAPLSLGALHFLLGQRLGLVLPRPALRRLHELSGGNPLFAIELGRSFKDGAIDLQPGGRLPSDLDELVSARLAAMPAHTRTVLAAAAALSRPTTGLLTLALGSDPERSLEPAVGAGILTTHAGEIRFAHPLLAAAAYSQVPLEARREIHRRLASALSDPEEIARHLALAVDRPDPVVASKVEEAAAAAFGRGATAAAADLALAARRLTPYELAEDVRRRIVAEAEYRFEAGDAPAADALVGELIVSMPAGPVRARLLSRQARYRHFAADVGGGVALLREALREAGDDPLLRASIEEGLAWGLLLVRRDLAQAADHARSAVRGAERAGDAALLAEALAAQGLTEFAVGRSPEEAFRRALELEAATLKLRILRHPSFAFAYWLTCSDELDRARDVFTELHRRAVEQGDESALAPIHTHLTLVEWLAGRWTEAERHALDGHALAVQTGQHPTQASILGKLALVKAARGDEDARDTAERSLSMAAGPAFDPSDPRAAMAGGGESALWALGHLSLSCGDADNADRYLRPLAEALLAAGIRDPGEMRSLPDAVEALVGLGRADAAERLLERLEATATAAGRPSPLALAARCRGLFDAVGGDPAAGLGALEASVRSLDSVPLPLERARSRLALGSLLRRMKRKKAARESLSEALAAFEALGARPWAHRARGELARIGGRAPSGGLTATEHRIAELLADGLSSKEVAAKLFVTTKTVETNVSRIYAKLGVHSRAALARRLAEVHDQEAAGKL